MFIPDIPEQMTEPAPGVKYNYAAVTFWRDNAWHMSPLDKPSDQDCLYAWIPLNLPKSPTE